jgi:hypothetical protein
MEELKGSMYMRIFGNELQYINSDDIKTLLDGKNFNILDFIINLSKEQDYSFTQSFMSLVNQYIKMFMFQLDKIRLVMGKTKVKVYNRIVHYIVSISDR